MKAEGGWGAVFTEFCSIHPESDEYPYTSARIWDEGDVRNLSYMCEVAHRWGSLAGVQLWYSGGNAPSLESREFGRAPSQWLSPIFATRSVYGCEMDELDIRTVINMYVEAGKRAEQAGFDLLEVSAGDDTLPMQFLEPRFNRRTDAYGGCFANRSRFFIELLHALRLEPLAALGSCAAVDFEGDNFTFYKPSHDDLRELFGAVFCSGIALSIAYSGSVAGREPAAQDMEPMSWAIYSMIQKLGAIEGMAAAVQDRADFPQLRTRIDKAFGQQKAGRQFVVVTRRAHREREAPPAQPDFQRLFDRDLIRDAFVVAIFFSADDAAGSDALHARSSHERKERRGEAIVIRMTSGSDNAHGSTSYGW